MSRAFVKEDGPDDPHLPDLPVSPAPNPVTPRGLSQLRDRLAAAQAQLASLRARPDRLDLLPEAAAARDIRYLEARLASAIPVPWPVAPATVVFGARVTVAAPDGRERTWAIVGEDEADASAGRLSLHAPLARVLLGAAVGDVVEWPPGRSSLSVIGLRSDES
jgi:transcription elongation GreA/GreB family factor